ncbi:MAG: hypothetical protein KBT50_04125 [Cycloclasticus sp.]|nr:hypothetical protein [Cycloclasticus sp.]MBQ0789784.1 hypothetical protein [Cycloclasticus sp.]
MHDDHKERLSSLLDLELPQEDALELFKEFEVNESLNKQFDRYALIREALSKDIVVAPDTFLRNVQQELSVEPILFANKKNKFNNKTYIAVGLAASFVIFSVMLSKVDLLGDTAYTAPTTASTGTVGKHNQQLALEKLQQEEEVIEEDRSPAVRFVTFEK